MDRRTFFGSAAAVCGSLVFSRKVESKDEQKGLTDEEMAEIILNHPLTVFLHGDTEYFGSCRDYYYAGERRLINGNVVRWSGKEDRIEKWRTGGTAIGCDCCLFGGGYAEDTIRRTRTKVVNGCRVEVHYHDLPSTRLSSEEWFDISQPKLKLVRCIGRDTHSTRYPRVIGRNFARFNERWVEV